jgi:hypothetical protein
MSTRLTGDSARTVNKVKAIPPWRRSPLRVLTPAQKRRRLEWLRAWHDEMHRLQWAEHEG